MKIVHKESSNGTRSGVDVFVIAPNGKINVPFVKLQVHVSDSMSQVPSDQDTLGVRVGSDGFDIKVLASVILNSWK